MLKKNLFLFCTLFPFLLTGCGSTSKSFTVMGAAPSTARGMLERLSLSSMLGTRVGAGSPTSFKINFFAFYASPNTDCTSPILVDDLGATAVEKDLYANPILFAADPAAGTYECVLIKMQDVMKFTPDATAVAAHAGCTSVTTEHTGEIYRAGESDSDLWKTEAGAAVTATGDGVTLGADTIFVVASTDPAAAKAGPLGFHEHQTVSLTSALVVPGQTTFVADFTNGIDGNATECGLERGAFEFK